MHEISFDRVESRRPLRLNIAPDAEDLRALAVRFGWVRVDGLKGSVELTRISQSSCQMRGALVADIVMVCGVSGDDVPTHLEIDVDERFAIINDTAAEVVVDAMGVEAEPIVNGTIRCGRPWRNWSHLPRLLGRVGVGSRPSKCRRGQRMIMVFGGACLKNLLNGRKSDKKESHFQKGAKNWIHRKLH